MFRFGGTHCSFPTGTESTTVTATSTIRTTTTAAVMYRTRPDELGLLVEESTHPYLREYDGAASSVPPRKLLEVTYHKRQIKRTDVLVKPLPLQKPIVLTPGYSSVALWTSLFYGNNSQVLWRQQYLLTLSYKKLKGMLEKREESDDRRNKPPMTWKPTHEFQIHFYTDDALKGQPHVMCKVLVIPNLKTADEENMRKYFTAQEILEKKTKVYKSSACVCGAYLDKIRETTEKIVSLKRKLEPLEKGLQEYESAFKKQKQSEYDTLAERIDDFDVIED